MRKELEALKKIGMCESGSNNNGRVKYLAHDTVEYSLLLKALTPPTADEVCEALSESTGLKVEYKNRFYYKSINLQMKFELEIDHVLKQALEQKRYDIITLIGRFYEGLEQ